MESYFRAMSQRPSNELAMSQGASKEPREPTMSQGVSKVPGRPY